MYLLNHTKLMTSDCDSAGYLHDHRIKGQILMPGAAMFELSAAAVRCLSNAAPQGLIRGISISAPLVVNDDISREAGKVLTCNVALATGRLEVRSFMAASKADAPAEQLHLGGWAAQAHLEHLDGKAHKGEARAWELRMVISPLRQQTRLPTVVAGILPCPDGTCGQPNGHAAHPAVLDSATHTAAAYASGSADSDEAGRAT